MLIQKQTFKYNKLVYYTNAKTYKNIQKNTKTIYTNANKDKDNCKTYKYTNENIQKMEM